MCKERMSTTKAMGPDLIPDKLFSTECISKHMDTIIKDLIRDSALINEHLKSRIALINKNVGIPNTSNIRPISVQNSMQKFIELSLSETNNKYTSVRQFVFKRNSSTHHVCRI